jgi:hypothetical protein
MRRALSTAVLLCGAAVLAQNAFSSTADAWLAGIILPVRLENSISSKKAKPGQILTARIMQDIPLPDRGRIREGSRVVGHVVEVTGPSSNGGAEISLHFDSLVVSKWTIPIKTSLRALASPLDIEDAQVPAQGADRGTSPSSYTTTQVGGEVVYRGGGHVIRKGEIVGEPVDHGVLVRVRASPDGRCGDAPNQNDTVQALWVFSSDACGVYGFAGVTIAHGGRTDPAGEITLKADKAELDIRSGSGMLLRVIPSEP